MAGYTLVSQQIRDLIARGIIKVPEKDISLVSKDGKKVFGDENLEKRVQPSSFEPSLENEVFFLDTQAYGLLSPRADESIYRALLQIPKIHRMQRSIIDGLELKGGYVVLAHLGEKINFDSLSVPVTHIRSSPKSSIGRLFPKTRLIADYNPYVDEIHKNRHGNLDLWLIIQPLPINMTLFPGLTLNQLRFFNGDARLRPYEIAQIETPILFDKEGNPIKLREEDVLDGITLHLDLEGKATYGIVGLKARNNPDPIDLSKKGFYNPAEYFAAIQKGDVKTGDIRHGLFASKEVVRIPEGFSAELERHSHVGIEGRTHDAGFIDNGFKGDLVFEISPDRESQELIDGKPISRMNLFRVSEIPDKIYGNEIGSNYQEQIGPRTSKHFKPFDFESTARNFSYGKKTLVQEAGRLLKHRKSDEGFEVGDEDSLRRLVADIEKGWFTQRYYCEDDSLVLQPIPYLLIFNGNKMIFTYLRTSEKKDYGETKLFGKVSFGIGGHLNPEDSPNFIENGLARIAMEEVEIAGSYSQPKFIGTLFSREKPVDTTHFGLVYSMHADGDIKAIKKSITKSWMFPIEDKISGIINNAELETWTRILAPHLSEIYEMGR